MSWPNGISESFVTDKPALGLDIMATIAAITEQKITTNQAMDSYNLLPILKQEKNAKTHPYIMLQGGSHKEVMIIEDGWKLIIQVDMKDKTYKNRFPIALFNLNDNVWEHEEFNFIHNTKYKNKVQKLLKLYNETRDGGVQTGSHF